MNQIETVKKICGILMAGGAAVLMFMISGLIHKACVIGADALDAAIHNREKKDKRLLLYTGISGGIHGLHGMILPVTAAAAASVIFIWMNPVKTSVIPVVLICLWGTAAACNLNIRYSIKCNQHASLFIRKFYAAYVSVQNREKAFDEACASIPDGAMKGRAIAAGKQLSRGVKWKSAVSQLDDGTSGGKGLSICLKMFGNQQPEPDTNAVNYFSELFFGDAAVIMKRSLEMANAELILLAALLAYTAVSIYCVRSALPAESAAVLLSAGFLLAVMTAGYRNICLRGRVL